MIMQSNYDIVLSKTSALATLFIGPQRTMQLVRIPKSYVDVLSNVIKEDKARGVYVTQSIFYSQQSLYNVSMELHNLFGASFIGIEKTIGDLLQRVNIEYMENDKLEKFVRDVFDGLSKKYGHQDLYRRNELGENIFSDPTVMHVESMQWQDFIRLHDAELIDSRENEIEGSCEFLYTYHGRQFLLSNCDSGNVVLLPVGDVSTCEQAQSWLIGDTIVGSPLPKFFSIGRV